MANEVYQYALAYASRGWKVFPLKGKSKIPPNKKKTFKNASTDPEQIKKWFKNKSNINIGIATGRDSNLFVLDIDVRNGTNGFEALKGLEDRFDELPPTLCCQTGSGGKHFYFEYVEGGVCTAGQLGAGIDTRGDGGSVVAPGSVHENGEPYVFEDYDLEDLKDANLNKCPEWLPPLLKKEENNIVNLEDHRNRRDQGNAPARPRGVWDGKSDIAEGGRNEAVFQYTCSLIGQGGKIETTMKRVKRANEKHCQPPLPDKEIDTLLTSAIERYVDKDHIQAGHIPPLEKELTETRHAQRFFNEHGKNIGFIYNQKRWILWNDKFWEIDDQGDIHKLLNATTENVWKRIAPMRDDPFNIKKRWLRYAVRLDSCVGIDNVLKLTSKKVPMEFSDFDQDPFLFNCANGVVDLKTGELKPHQHGLYLSQYSDYNYDPKINCDGWLKFLDKVMGRNDELISYIQRAIGYALTGSTSEQCLFILHGSGQNGKSTFLNILQELFGNYGQTTHMRAFTFKGENESVRNDIARLHNTRLVSTTELGRGKKLDMPLIKEITGGDEVTARFLYSEYFSYVPKYKIFMAVNVKPKLSDYDPATWRRIQFIPFTVKIPNSELISQADLMKGFRKEMPGILSWAVKGTKEWLEIGLQPPPIVVEAIRNYKSEVDPMSDYLETRCTGDLNDSVFTEVLFEDYRTYCMRQDSKPPDNVKSFGRLLGVRGHKSKVKKIKENDEWITKRIYYGFKLLN